MKIKCEQTVLRWFDNIDIYIYRRPDQIVIKWITVSKQSNRPNERKIRKSKKTLLDRIMNDLKGCNLTK